jgi:hypothetical protein
MKRPKPDEPKNAQILKFIVALLYLGICIAFIYHFSNLK